MTRSLLLVVCWWCLVGLSQAQDTSLRMLITDYPPLIDLSRQDKGPHGRLMFSALNEIGQDYTIEEYSWSRIVQMLNTQSVCSFAWLKTADRLKRWRYSHPYLTETSFLFGRKDNPLVLTSLQDVKKFRIGVTRSYSYGEQLDAILATMPTDESNTDEANIRKLLAGRIDLYPTEQTVMDGLLQMFFPDSKGVLEPKFKVGELSHHFVCHRDYVLGGKVIKALNAHFGDDIQPD